MTPKFNKRVLAAAIAAAVVLPGVATAAKLDYPTNTQITFAKDLIPRESSSITTPAGLTLIGTAVDTPALTAVAAGNTLRVTITLDNNAKFNSNAQTAMQIAQAVTDGTQLGGAGAVLPPGNITAAYYSSGDGELIFEYKASGAGAAVFGAADYALQFPAMQIINLRQGLYTGSSVSAEITVSNVTTNAKVLGAKRVLVRSQWGEDADFFANTIGGLPAKYIDVVGCDLAADTFARRTRFGTSTPGSACGLAGNTRFRVGEIDLFITEANLEGSFGGASVGQSYVRNTNGVAAWSLVPPTIITYTLKGEALPSNIWLDQNANCSKAANQFLPLSRNADATEGRAQLNMATADAGWMAYFAGVTTPNAPVPLYVCVGSQGNEELFQQDLMATVDVEHVLNTQYVNPPQMAGAMAPLLYNAGLLTFQNVNPAGTPSAQSFLRLTNNNKFDCPVTIDAKDDLGRHSGEVKLTVKAHASEQLNSSVLENGGDARVTGKFGDGTGKWYVRVSPDCSNFKASALNRNNTDGTVTNLTPEKGIGVEWRTPAVKIN